MKGVVRYDDEGKPICELCDKSFKRILPHVRQKHFLNEREYKIKFSLDLNKGICSKESSEKTRIKTLENYDKVIKINLIKKGSTKRFTNGSKGRTKEMVSEQTRTALRKRLYTPQMQEVLKESGRKVGKSGLGNKARWNT